MIASLNWKVHFNNINNYVFVSMILKTISPCTVVHRCLTFFTTKYLTVILSCVYMFILF